MVTTRGYGAALDQNHPNPFNPSTMIRFTVPEPAFVRLVVVDVRGREVVSLLEQTVQPSDGLLAFLHSLLGFLARWSIRIVHQHRYNNVPSHRSPLDTPARRRGPFAILAVYFTYGVKMGGIP